MSLFALFSYRLILFWFCQQKQWDGAAGRPAVTSC